MFESTDIKLKRAAIILVEKLSYPQIAAKFSISSAALRKQIATFEEKGRVFRIRN